MAGLRLLVVEGNTAEGRARHLGVSGVTPSEAYAGVLKDLAGEAVVDICFPADPGANIPDSAGIAGYDGVAITGSSLNLWRAEPEALRQVELPDLLLLIIDASGVQAGLAGQRLDLAPHPADQWHHRPVDT